LIIFVFIAVLTSCTRPPTPPTHLQAGQAALDKGDTTAAIRELETVIGDDPKLVEARVLLGRAYEQAGIGPAEIDCFEVQDTDAFCELEIYEALRLCPEGEAGRLIDEGVTQIGGKYPVNMSGGLISKGEPVGASHLGQVFEIVMQLRGQAGNRQVEGAKVGLAHVLGAGNNCAVTIMKS
jgi:acetyl-CoA acetyltransferase